MLRLIVHVGLPRAGTRHLRNALTARRRELAAAGVGCPDELPAFGLDVPLEAQLGAYLTPQLDRARRWLTGHAGPAVLCAEQLAAADAGQARQVLARLGSRPETTTVVVTACDLDRLLPARWQASVESGSAEPFETYLRALLARPERRGAAGVDLAETVDRWREIVGTERVVVVTVPPHGSEPGLLWARFVQGTGLPAALAGRADRAPVPDPTGNADDVPLSGVQAQLLRALNEAMRAEGLSVRAQQALRARVLGIWGTLTPPARARPCHERLAVPPPLQATVRARADQDVTYLRTAGVRVVGPLTDLEPRFDTAPAGPQPLETALGRSVLALLAHDHAGSPRPGPAPRQRRGLQLLTSWRQMELGGAI